MVQLDPVSRALLHAATDPGDRDSEPGFPTIEPGQQKHETAAAACSSSRAASAGDITSMVGARKRRAAKAQPEHVGDADDTGSTTTSKAKPSIRSGVDDRNHLATSLKGAFLKEFYNWAMSHAQIESAFKKEAPKELQSRIRFWHVGPGSKLAECDVCGESSRETDPTWGPVMHTLWAHVTVVNDEIRIQGCVCYGCNYTMRRRYMGFKLWQFIQHVKDKANREERVGVVVSSVVLGCCFLIVLASTCVSLCLSRSLLLSLSDTFT